MLFACIELFLTYWYWKRLITQYFNESLETKYVLNKYGKSTLKVTRNKKSQPSVFEFMETETWEKVSNQQAFKHKVND